MAGWSPRRCINPWSSAASSSPGRSDGGALITRNRGYLQNLVTGLSGYGSTATVLVVQGEPAVVVAASNPKLIGTSLDSLQDAALRDAKWRRSQDRQLLLCARIGFDRTVAVLPLVPASRLIEASDPAASIPIG